MRSLRLFVRRSFSQAIILAIGISAFYVGAPAVLANQTLSFAGNTILSTPNMDRIAREGFVFKNAFVVNGLCLPSRATLLTRQYSHTTRAVSNVEGTLPKQFQLISDVLIQLAERNIQASMLTTC